LGMGAVTRDNLISNIIWRYYALFLLLTVRILCKYAGSFHAM
jgi:hypothetical protein